LGAVELGQFVIHDDDVGAVTVVELDGFLAGVGFGDDAHVGSRLRALVRPMRTTKWSSTMRRRMGWGWRGRSFYGIHAGGVVLLLQGFFVSTEAVGEDLTQPSPTRDG